MKALTPSRGPIHVSAGRVPCSARWKNSSMVCMWFAALAVIKLSMYLRSALTTHTASAAAVAAAAALLIMH